MPSLILYYGTDKFFSIFYLSAEIYQPKQFYPEAEATKKMMEIKQWLKSKGIADLPRVALDVDRLDSVC